MWGLMKEFEESAERFSTPYKGQQKEWNNKGHSACIKVR